MPKEIYTYGFPRDKRWPEGVYPVPLEPSGDGNIEWPRGPIVVYFDSSAEFVRKVFRGRPGKLTTAVVIPPDKVIPPERHLAYFGGRILEDDEQGILAFLQEK